jgi:hypothetical protein
MLELTLRILRCVPREPTHLGEWTLVMLALTVISVQREALREMRGTTAAPRDPTVLLESKPNAQLACMEPWREPRMSFMDVRLAHQATTAKRELHRLSLFHVHREDTVLRVQPSPIVQPEHSTIIFMEEVSVTAGRAQLVNSAVK